MKTNPNVWCEIEKNQKINKMKSKNNGNRWKSTIQQKKCNETERENGFILFIPIKYVWKNPRGSLKFIFALFYFNFFYIFCAFVAMKHLNKNVDIKNYYSNEHNIKKN